MTRKRNEALVEQARALAAEGMTQAQAASELGVPLRTLQSWDVEWPRGRPPVSGEQASSRTLRRRRSGK